MVAMTLVNVIPLQPPSTILSLPARAAHLSSTGVSKHLTMSVRQKHPQLVVFHLLKQPLQPVSSEKFYSELKDLLHFLCCSTKFNQT